MAEDSIKTERSLRPPDKWDYSVFKEYLISQARGKDFLLPLNDLPREIEINQDWHNTFNVMRNKTNGDDIERVALVGANLTTRSIYLPKEEVAEVPWQWERNSRVSQVAIQLQMNMAKSRGAEAFVGILHSHPPHDIDLLLYSIKTGRLSAGDIWIALSGYYGSMIGVTDGGINSMAFKTRDSIVPKDTKELFTDLYEREPQIKNLDSFLAQRYKVALYKGEINGNLQRVYPKK